MNKQKQELTIPSHLNENEVLATIDVVAKTLAPKYTFGYMDVDDIVQIATMMAIESLDKYDSDRPLRNFLFISVANSLKNYKRDNYYRMGVQDDSKRRLLEPIDIHNVRQDNESSMYYEPDPILEITQNEVLALIDQHLDPKLRSNYLRMTLGNTKLSKKERDELYTEIRNILIGFGYDEEAESWTPKQSGD